MFLRQCHTLLMCPFFHVLGEFFSNVFPMLPRCYRYILMENPVLWILRHSLKLKAYYFLENVVVRVPPCVCLDSCGWPVLGCTISPPDSNPLPDVTSAKKKKFWRRVLRMLDFRRLTTKYCFQMHVLPICGALSHHFFSFITPRGGEFIERHLTSHVGASHHKSNTVLHK